MTNLEALMNDLDNVRIHIATLKIEERTILERIATQAAQESDSNGSVAVTHAEAQTAARGLSDALTKIAKKPVGKKPDPKSKRQRAFRMIQKNWGNKAIAKALKLDETHVSAYRRELKHGARVAGV